MNYTIGEKELEFNVKLGTTVKIKKAFNKNFNDILKTLDKLDIEELMYNIEKIKNQIIENSKENDKKGEQEKN